MSLENCLLPGKPIRLLITLEWIGPAQRVCIREGRVESNGCMSLCSASHSSDPPAVQSMASLTLIRLYARLSSLPLTSICPPRAGVRVYGFRLHRCPCERPVLLLCSGYQRVFKHTTINMVTLEHAQAHTQ